MIKLNYDKLIDTYHEKEFYLEPLFDKTWDGHRWIRVFFKDINNKNVDYFWVDGRWHPKKREIDYDWHETQFDEDLKRARQQIRRNRMKRKMYRIKKDFQ